MYEGLTEHQKEVLISLLESPERVVALVGAGGVGKSHTIATFIRETSHSHNVAITGTTHRAVKNISDMAGWQAETIHKFLGFVLVNDQSSSILRPIPNFYPEYGIDYLIIEEASMMTKQLMDRLIKMIDECSIGKVIFIGDAVQLRLPGSIDMSTIPMFELTQQMRQRDTPNVSSALKMIRTVIELRGKELPELPSGVDLIVHDNHCTFLKAYKKSDVTDKIFIAYQNRTVKIYNTNVKRYIQKDDNIYSPGDIIYPTSPIIMTVKGKKQTIIHNRELCVIQSVEEYDEYFELFTDNGLIKTPKSRTRFQEVLDDMASRREWSDLYALKDAFADVHHTFAGTAHSLQGASISEVYIDYSDMVRVLDSGNIDDLHRLLYVAMSRCITKVHIFVGDERNYKCLGKYTPKNLKE